MVGLQTSANASPSVLELQLTNAYNAGVLDATTYALQLPLHFPGAGSGDQAAHEPSSTATLQCLPVQSPSDNVE